MLGKPGIDRWEKPGGLLCSLQLSNIATIVRQGDARVKHSNRIDYRRGESYSLVIWVLSIVTVDRLEQEYEASAVLCQKTVRS
jgi:hypothetical protein